VPPARTFAWRYPPTPPLVRLAGVAGLVGIAVTHLLDLPDKLSEAHYMAALFCALIAASLALAVPIALDRATRRVWPLAGLLSATTIAGYVVSRTVGLPQLGDHVGMWHDNVGTASLVCESAVIALAALVWTRGVLVSPGRLVRTSPVLALVGGLTLVVGSAAAWGGTSPVTITPYQVALPIAPVLSPTSTDATTDYYNLDMTTASGQIVPGKTTPEWGYNGSSPGPTIVAQSGRTVKVHATNRLPEAMSLHLHGGHQASSSDGLPDDLIQPGASKDYTYPTSALSARPLWYHDHANMTTAMHVWKGMAGFMLIHDSQEKSLGLPTDYGVNDIPLAIMDRAYNADGTLSYSDGTGNTMIVNGAPAPYLKVATRKMRFRLLNASSERNFTFALSNSQAMTQIGNEGGLLPTHLQLSSITLAPAERADVIIDFSKLAVGTSVKLINTDRNGPTDVMRFDVNQSLTDLTTIPATLRPIAKLSTTGVAQRTFELSRGRDNVWQINQQSYDPARIDASPKLGTTEIWTFDNRSGDDHPMHMHDVNFQVLDIDGRAPTGANAAWKETVNVPGWKTVRVAARFEDFTGKFVFHCHRLEHEDNMMMGQFSVVP
jgi:FtsP/CotA-like multicopper oxidase with cupredoxin domain